MKAKTKTKKPKQPDTPVGLLKYVLDHYDLGPALNKRIAAATTASPLTSLPEFLGIDKTELTKLDVGVERIYLGRAHGHTVNLYHYKYTNRTTLCVGCRRFNEEKYARHHWAAGISRLTREPRPHATALLDFIVEVCAFYKWGWP